MKKLCLLLLLSALTGSAFAQRNTFDGSDLRIYRTVKESKDSVYTTVFDYGDGRMGRLSKKGKIATIVTPDSVRYVITQDGPVCTLLDADKNRTIWIDKGNKTTIIHPDGKQSVLTTTLMADYRSSVIVNPEGAVTTITDNIKATLIVNPDGTKSYSYKTGPNTILIVNADGSQKTITTP